MERFAAEDGNAQAADWYGAATGTPGILYGDGYHARPEGYALRGAILADAIAACSGSGSGGGDLSGIPAPSGKQGRPPGARRRRRGSQGLNCPLPRRLQRWVWPSGTQLGYFSAAGRGCPPGGRHGPPEPVLGAAE